MHKMLCFNERISVCRVLAPSKSPFRLTFACLPSLRLRKNLNGATEVTNNATMAKLKINPFFMANFDYSCENEPLNWSENLGNLSSSSTGLIKSKRLAIFLVVARAAFNTFMVRNRKLLVQFILISLAIYAYFTSSMWDM